MYQTENERPTGLEIPEDKSATTRRRVGCIISAIIILAIPIIFVLSCNACMNKDKNEEWGNFLVSFYNERTTAYITGLTEKGQQQKYIVIPKEIDGIPVVAIGTKPLLTLFGGLGRVQLRSDVLEKIFVLSHVGIASGTFEYCPNLSKALSVFGGHIEGLEWGTITYIPNDIYLQDTDTGYKRANVSYLFNYDNAENYGYYLIDDYDYGEKIEFIPPDPDRENYTFGGWYKEPECINKWDFVTDTLPEEKIEINENGEEDVVYQETKLYAKWV